MADESRDDSTLPHARRAKSQSPTPRWASVWPVTADALSKVNPARYDIKLIDADQNRQAVQDLGVKIIPTVIVFRDGEEITRLPNMMSIDQLP